MPTVSLVFTRLVMHGQRINAPDERFSATVYVTITSPGEEPFETTTVLKQVVGSAFVDQAIEVGKPEGYRGPYNHEAFAEAALDYYEQVLHPEPSRRLAKAGVRMTGDPVDIKRPLPPVTIEVKDGSSSW